MPAYGAQPSPNCPLPAQETDTTASPLGCNDGLITIPGPDGPTDYACTGPCCTQAAA